MNRIKTIIILSAVLLLFTFPAFSYDEMDKESLTPIERAAFDGDYDRFMLISSSSINKQLYTKEESLSLINLAAQGGNLRLVDYLIKKGFPVNDKVWNPLHSASFRGHNDVIKLLINSGADVNLVSEQGQSALYIAVRQKNVDTVKCLLSLGAEAGSLEDKYNNPVYQALVMNQDLETFKILEERINPILLTSKFYSELFYSSLPFSDDKTMKYLYEKGADLNSPTEKGFYPAVKAAEFGHYLTLDWLMDRGAKLDVKQPDGGTPFHFVFRFLNTDDNKEINVIKKMIAKGADINARDNDGYTVFHYGAENVVGCLCCEGTNIINWHQDKIFHILVSNGGKIDTVNKKGQTPLHIAIENENENFVRNLVNYGADPFVRDNNGNTPFMIALDKKNWGFLLIMIQRNPFKTMLHFPQLLVLLILIMGVLFHLQRKSIVKTGEKERDAGRVQSD